MQQNNNLPIGNEQNVQFSPMNQGNQGFQNNLMQGQSNMSPFNNMPNINFQNMNQAQMNNFNLNQLALRNRLQNMGGMNPNNLNAMGMGVYNQMNAMNMMNNMGGNTMNVNGGNIAQNNPIKNWNPADPNVSNMGNNNISMNNDKPILNQIPINMNPQTQNFPPNFNISQANNYMYQQPINYMNYAINPNIPNNPPQNQNKDSNLINQAIKSQLAVRDMQNQAKLYNQRAKNEGKKVMNFGNVRPLNLQTPTKEEFQVQNINNVPTELNNAMQNPSTIGIQSKVKVELSEDAIRYESSKHLQKRVALYRYKDTQYQAMGVAQNEINKKIYLEKGAGNKLKMAGNLNPNLGLNPNKFKYFKAGESKNSRVLCYDIEEGPIFFRNTPHLTKQLEDIAEQEEILVPIRLDLEVGGQRLCDTFVWNLNDEFISVDLFVETMLKDLQLPHQAFFHPVSTSIKDQIKDYRTHGLYCHKKIKQFKIKKEKEKEKESYEAEEELRILIKLDITLGRVSLEDQFEWDILNPLNSPELFASNLANDLGLGGEFKTAIAHSIREQVYTFHKSLSILGYNFTGDSVNDVNLSKSFLPPITHTIRDKNATESFTPFLVEISEVELQRQTKIQERENRRTRRQQRAGRRGAILPEREPIRTTRTIIKQKKEFMSSTFPYGNPGALGGRAISGPVTKESIKNKQHANGSFNANGNMLDREVELDGFHT